MERKTGVTRLKEARAEAAKAPEQLGEARRQRSSA